MSETLDDKLRVRLAEIRSAAGVPHAQVSMEVLYFLPKDFLDSYADLFTRAVRADGGEDARARSQQAAGEVEKARGSAAKAGRRWKKSWVVQDERLLMVKTMVDKRLRALAREMQTLIAGGDVEKATELCGKCRGIVKNSWKYCPMCGSLQS